jgi:hypothetical protein
VTPNAKSNDFLTKDGVENLIRLYDQGIIIPRENKTNDVNEKRHEENLEVQNEHTSLLKEWNGSLKTIKWLVGVIGIPIFLMILTLFIDFIKWGITHDWKY